MSSVEEKPNRLDLSILEESPLDFFMASESPDNEVEKIDEENKIKEEDVETKESSDASDENSDSDSDEDDDTLSLNLQKLTFTENSDLYVVSVDGKPRFYVDSKEKAIEKMWNVARILAYESQNYHIHYMKISENELHLAGTYWFFLLRHEVILNRISYDKVQECV